MNNYLIKLQRTNRDNDMHSGLQLYISTQI
jgi:hypothetical protein